MSWKKEILILIYAILFILKERWNLSQTPNPVETDSKKEQNGPQTGNENPLRYTNPKKENRLDKVPRFLVQLIPALQGRSACERTACKWAGHRSKRTRHEWENEDAGQGHHPTQGGGDGWTYSSSAATQLSTASAAEDHVGYGRGEGCLYWQSGTAE